MNLHTNQLRKISFKIATKQNKIVSLYTPERVKYTETNILGYEKPL